MSFRYNNALTWPLLAACCISTPVAAQNYKGLYVMSVQNIFGSATALAETAAYRKPFIDGVVLILHWGYLEPAAPGQTLPPNAGITDPITGETFCPLGTATHHTNFCWQELNEQLTHIPPGKKLSLAVVAGGFTPPWLATNPTYAITTTGPLLYASKGGLGANCFHISLPLPSTAALPGQSAPSSFAAGYVQMMQQVATYLQSKGRLADVSIIKISASISTVTEEFHLDAATTSATCLTPATPAWASAGYTPTATETAFEYIAQNVSAIFPHALPSFDILENSFTDTPLIDDTGTIFTAADYTKNPTKYGTLLLDRALAALAPAPGQPGILGATPVSVQWDGLQSADQQTLTTAAPHTLAAGANGAVIAFQANEMSGPEGSICGTAACASATSPTVTCNGTATCIAEYASLLANGINPIQGTPTQSAFLEVWSADAIVPCLAPALQAAHNALTGSSLAISKTCK